MLTVGPSQYHRDDTQNWWVQANGALVATMASDHAGRCWAHLNLHHALRRGGNIQHIELDSFDTERLERWARANEARLLRECPEPPPRPPYVDPCSLEFKLTPPEPRPVRRRPVLPW